MSRYAKYADLTKLSTEYASRMLRLSNRKFGEVAISRAPRPDPKRQKISDGEKEVDRIFSPDAAKFEHIVNKPAYIDHSGFIKNVFNKPRLKWIVAPSRFCKSLNLEMVLSFSEIEVHSAGENQGKAIRDVTGPAKSLGELSGNGLKNYDLFCKGKCQILEDEDFVKEHFGRYPVVKLDFAVDEISSFEDALGHCKRVIHRAFQKHEYLETSTKLADNEIRNKMGQTDCQNWIYDVSYKKMSEEDTKDALENLCEYLYKHFGRKVILLVDELDAIVNRAKFSVKLDELKQISNFHLDVLGPALKGTSCCEYVEFVFMTGISVVADMGWSRRMAGVEKYKFLDNEEFARFYGVDENDLEDLISNLKDSKSLPLFENQEKEDIVDEIKKEFNGYYSPKGRCILSLWSVLHYLQKKEVNSHIKPYMTHIVTLFKHRKIAAKLLRLIGKEAGKETIEFAHRSDATVEELIELAEPTQKEEPNDHLVMNYMRDLGYLSNVKNEPRKLKIANEEIRRRLMRALVEARKPIAGLNFRVIELAAEKLSTLIDTANDHQFSEQLKDFHKTLQELLGEFSYFHNVQINESVIMSVMAVTVGRMDCQSFGSDCQMKDEEGNIITSGKPNVWMIHGNFVIIIEIKSNTFSQSHSGKDKDKKRTSLYALQQILGAKEKKEGYVNAINRLKVKNFLLLGLSMNEKFEVSISCLRNSSDLKYAKCVSKGEPQRFEEYYKGVTVIGP